jgi:hypothetical protein
MTVEELIEELQRLPNRRLPVLVLASGRRDDPVYLPPRVVFHGPHVTIEED